MNVFRGTKYFGIIVNRWFLFKSISLLRISIGVIFLWFGALKFFDGYSPAQDLAIETIQTLTWGLIPSTLSLKLLGTWECILGVGLMAGRFMKLMTLLLLLHLLSTLSTLFIVTHKMFTNFPFILTLEGQYVLKNLVIIAATLVINAMSAQKGKKLLS